MFFCCKAPPRESRATARQSRRAQQQLIGISKSASTYQKYEVTRKHLENFVRYKYNLSDIALQEINLMFITDFEVYLKTICKCNSNTTAKFMQFFKRIVLIARNNGIIIGDSFANYKIRLKKVDRGYLTEDEIKKILELNLVSERLEQVCDIFVFSCFCGLAYIDVAGLRKEHIRKSFDGNLWIMTKRVKTGTDVNVPLLDIPKMILDKYKNKLPNGEILTFHHARHTFATTTTLSNGVPIETVSKMLDHTNIETTQIYARITNNKISDDMKGLSEQFSGIEKIYKKTAQ